MREGEETTTEITATLTTSTDLTSKDLKPAGTTLAEELFLVIVTCLLALHVPLMKQEKTVTTLWCLRISTR